MTVGMEVNSWIFFFLEGFFSSATSFHRGPQIQAHSAYSQSTLRTTRSHRGEEC